MTTSSAGIAKIPDTMSFTDAATIPLGLSTAAGMAFETATLQLRYPLSSSSLSTFTSPSPPEVVTVWGGSSSVGANAIQMIRAAGYHVIALSSTHNHDVLKQCGADACFDYNDDNLTSKLTTFVRDKGWVSAGILAAAGFLPPGPVAETTRKRTGELALSLGGKKFVSTPLARGIMDVPEMPEGVEASNVLGISEEPVRKAIWEEWLYGALESGQLKALPPAEVVGEGLEGIDGALEVARKGYSAKKIVVRIC